ncbi:divergent polysaccharide deacetylase family protein [Hypericibacter sp.]|uniref:divergent polysaccharide deacetylase family protein n=1 Tax=Hypericibacter sp. TaxID=2705401 RepID=UPI003D6D708D
MTARRRNSRGAGSKKRSSGRGSTRASIFPIGPRRRGRAPKPSWRRSLLRLAGAPLWLLLALLLGAVAVGVSQGWFTSPKPHPVASAPGSSSSPTVVTTFIPEPLAKPQVPPTAAVAPPPTPAAPVYEESSSAPAVFDSSSETTQAPAPIARPAPADAAPSLPSTSASATWLAYAVPVPDTQGRPMIAIVIDDVGLDRANSARAIALPGPLTISFMTYAEHLDQQSALAREHGHELMLHVPMEPMDQSLDAGPQALRTDLAPDELKRRIDWDLTRLSGIVGINNHMGSKFSRSTEGMSLVMQALRERGLLFLDSRTIADSVGSKEAAAYGVPHADRDVFLDDDQSPAKIDEMLAELERIARKRGYAVGIGHPHPATIAALQRWLPTAAQRGFALVPISAIVRRMNGVTG